VACLLVAAAWGFRAGWRSGGLRRPRVTAAIGALGVSLGLGAGLGGASAYEWSLPPEIGDRDVEILGMASSPDGKWLAMHVTRAGRDGHSRWTRVWLVDLGTGQVRPTTGRPATLEEHAPWRDERTLRLRVGAEHCVEPAAFDLVTRGVRPTSGARAFAAPLRDRARWERFSWANWAGHRHVDGRWSFVWDGHSFPLGTGVRPTREPGVLLVLRDPGTLVRHAMATGEQEVVATLGGHQAHSITGLAPEGAYVVLDGRLVVDLGAGRVAARLSGDEWGSWTPGLRRGGVLTVHTYREATREQSVHLLDVGSGRTQGLGELKSATVWPLYAEQLPGGRFVMQRPDGLLHLHDVDGRVVRQLYPPQAGEGE